VTAAFDRVSMHGVRRTLLERQAAATGLPSIQIEIPSPCPNEVYEAAMTRALASARADGVTHVVFGDLFLADLRAWREERLAQVGMTGVFPLWLRDTAALAKQMIADGMRAIVTCVDPRKLDRSFAGRTWDASFLADLPPEVDPCGENGEFHTFVSAGPMFAAPLPVTPGEVVERDGFVFADLR
jgi:uncharacterized protein (TIGR00290 family)